MYITQTQDTVLQESYCLLVVLANHAIGDGLGYGLDP